MNSRTTFLSVLLLVLLIGCLSSQETQKSNNLIANDKINKLTKELALKKNHPKSIEWSILTALANNDSTEAQILLNKQINSFGSDTLMTSSLKDILATDQIRNCNSHNLNIYRLSIGYSLHWSSMQLTLTQRIDSNSVTLNILHLGYDFDNDNHIDVDTIFSDRKISISINEWERFNELLEKSYYWNITSFKKRQPDQIDGSDWKLEGYRQIAKGNPQYHVLEIWSPAKGSFRAACEYLLALSGEDLNRYSEY